MARGSDESKVWSAGHGARTSGELIALLRDGGVRCLADVRRHPASRRHPQHGRGVLERTLGAAGIEYVWLGESLGGRREQTVAPELSRNGALRDAALRSYADAMDTREFQEGVEELVRLAHTRPTCMLCAERLYARCHRSLLADLLAACGWRIVHLLEPGHSELHALSPWARLDGEGRLHYPALA